MLDRKSRRAFDNMMLVVLIYFSYRLLETYYYDIFYMLASLRGWDINEWIMKRGFFLDAWFCIFALPIYLVWFLLRFKKERRELLPHLKGREKLAAQDRPLALILRCIILTFGIGGISSLWLDFADSYLDGFHFFATSMESFQEAWSGVGEEPYLWVSLSVVFFGPLVEELLFRGLIYHYVRELDSMPAAILISAAAFGIWHGEPVQVVYTTLMGVCLAIVYYRTNSMLYPVLIHVLNNFLSTLPPALDIRPVWIAIDLLSRIMILPAIVILSLMYYRARQMYRYGSDTKEVDS